MMEAKQWTLQNVTPDDQLWGHYLEMCYHYILESWPAAAGASKKDFIPAYEKELKQRIQEGPRFFFFLIHTPSQEIMGLTNLYLDKFDLNTARLHIAEFYVLPNRRHRTYGTVFFYLIIKWSIQNNIMHLRIEVDKELKSSNTFWQKMGLKFDGTGLRNVYSWCLQNPLPVCKD